MNGSLHCAILRLPIIRTDNWGCLSSMSDLYDQSLARAILIDELCLYIDEAGAVDPRLEQLGQLYIIFLLQGASPSIEVTESISINNDVEGSLQGSVLEHGSYQHPMLRRACLFNPKVACSVGCYRPILGTYLQEEVFL